MTRDEAENYILSNEEAFAVESVVRGKVKAFIGAQQGFDPDLSAEWLEEKGHSLHYEYTFETINNMGIQFTIDNPSSRDFDVVGYSDGFQYSSYQYIKSKGTIRSFLPSNEAAFDGSGEATPALCEWLHEFVIEAVMDLK